jgi:hypothetical protein
MVLELGHFRKQIRNTENILICGAGEGWRRSGGQNKRSVTKSQRGQEYSTNNRKEGRLNGLDKSCVGTTF